MFTLHFSIFGIFKVYLRQWDVPRKVAEHRFLLVDGLRLAAVVVDVRLERGGLDADDCQHEQKTKILETKYALTPR